VRKGGPRKEKGSGKFLMSSKTQSCVTKRECKIRSWDLCEKGKKGGEERQKRFTSAAIRVNASGANQGQNTMLHGPCTGGMGVKFHRGKKKKA